MVRLAPSILLVLLQACAASTTRTVAGTAKPSATPPPQRSAIAPAANQPASKAAPVTGQPEPPRAAPARPKPAPHPLAGLGDRELEQKLLRDPKSLGSISIGRTNAGALFNPVQMPKGQHWNVVNPAETWGTRETVDALVRCIRRVNQVHAGTPPIHVGDISLPGGGHFPPHVSHQSGRDVDLGYYYTDKSQWYQHAGKTNLDLPRTWTLVKAILTETDVERIFMDTSIQRLLKSYALSVGENAAWLDSVFGGPLSSDPPIIRYAPGHATHLHIRFYNPIAQETGRRMYKLLLTHNKIKPPTYYVRHKVRRGDTLIKLARRYDTTVRAIKRANRLRSTRIYTNRVYKIPRRGGVARIDRVEIPPRRLPPQPRTSSSRNAAAPER